MENVSFFFILFCNLKCAFCRNKSCASRFYPQKISPSLYSEDYFKKNLHFFYVLFSNLKCAFCENKFCAARYYPYRIYAYFYNGKKMFIQCEKDEEKYYNKMFKL